MVRIHAIQTGKVGVKEKYMYGEGQDIRRLLNTLTDKTWLEPLPIYAWVIEHPEGIIVVDTGESHLASLGGYFAQWHPFTRDARMYVSPEEEIGVQLMQMGISSQDVRQVILTNMHTDHIGGLHHFPHSEILVGRKEYETAQGLRGRLMGYLPQRFPRWLHPRLVDFMSEAVGPFSSSFPLTKANDIVLIPTPGHSAGHLSVLVREEEKTIFLAGDPSFTEKMLLDQLIDGAAPDEQAARQTLKQILEYVRTVPTVYLPSHDPEARERLVQRQTVLFPETIKAAL